MIGFAGGQIRIHEVEVPTKRRVVESSSVRYAGASAAQGGVVIAPEPAGERADRHERFGVSCADGDAQRVEHADLELFERLSAERIESGAGDDTSKIPNFGLAGFGGVGFGCAGFGGVVFHRGFAIE